MDVKLLIDAVDMDVNNLPVFKKKPFTKSMRLRTRQQYQRLNQKSKRFTGEWIIVDIQVNHKTSSRLGITVTKRFGFACQRNRFKRIVREAFRTSCVQAIPTYDLSVRPRSNALNATMFDVQQELFDFIDQFRKSSNEELAKRNFTSESRAEASG